MSAYLSVSLNRLIRPIEGKKNPISPLWQALVYPEGADISVGKACRFDSTDGASG